MKEKGFSESGRLLQQLGKENDGLVLSPKMAPESRSRISWLRVGVVVVVMGLGLGMFSLTIRTGAQSAFPKESELERRIPGLGVAEVVAPTPTEDERAPGPTASPQQRLLHRSRDLRARLGPNIIPFANRSMLQDSLFQELMNMGAHPVSIEVEVLRVQGSKDKDAERPVLANVRVRLRGAEADDPDDALRGLEDRLMLSWHVLGKYATQGKVAIGEAQIEVGQPTPWSERYDGRRLTGFWTGRISPEAFFLQGG